jgi:hypothetical protein
MDLRHSYSNMHAPMRQQIQAHNEAIGKPTSLGSDILEQ